MPVEAGVRHDLKLGEGEPRSALEAVALALAERIDNRAPIDNNTLAGLSRELRLTLAQLRADGQDTGEDVVDRLSTSANGP